MYQIHSVLGKIPKACGRKVRGFDDEMDEFGHTPPLSYLVGRNAFDPLRRRKCSKLQAVPCAFLLTAGQNRSVLINS